MSRRLPYETIRKNLWLRRDLVEFFEGTQLAKPEELRIGYGFNNIINELLAERMRKMLEEERQQRRASPASETDPAPAPAP